MFGFVKIASFLVVAANLVAAAPSAAVAGTAVPGEYIVVFKKNAAAAAVQSHVSALKGANWAGTAFAGQGFGLKAEYSFGGFRGYHAKLPQSAVEKLSNDPNVEYFEPNKIVTVQGTQTNVPSWGISRVDQRAGPADSTYVYPDSAGAGVDAYIIDTGIYISHPDFEGRAKVGASFVTGDGDADGNGHGTHVSGTIGSKTYGIAKKVNLIAVKVLNAQGSGTNAGVIQGVQWVATNAPKTGRKSVANMSLGGSASTALDQAVQAAIQAGVSFAIAAGNSAGDACALSPGRVPEAVTVGASDSSDTFASFSEGGSCVDIVGPGVSITSTWNNGQTNSISGTSMATPHVAGVIALVLSEGKASSPAEVSAYLKSVATKNVIKNIKANTPNLLLSNVFGDVVPPSPTATATTVQPTATATQKPTPTPTPSKCRFPACLWTPSCSTCDWGR
ncbi:peptidase S8/S53 domain-containing protein [Fimicolochytrium jonesii]|uniref:peptidase S8/S53 domain-containing protein n=1 Tax=Fimicolochytrium jonesii TaxID=1396493 RepID=UPI0022FF39B8|nr:peptidase S8/S53 domain-containing protein [Fimicolochytrium jonesii]KAI8818367.1 peptidase S8/S53 domain-containing protein [Fimicolochytrium jonesii]